MSRRQGDAEDPEHGGGAAGGGVAQDVALAVLLANRANFSLQDVRDLDQRLDLRARFNLGSDISAANSSTCVGPDNSGANWMD